MAYFETTVGLLIKQGDMAGAAAELLRIGAVASGNVCHAAKITAVDVTTFRRWVRIVDEHGFNVRGKLSSMRAERPRASALSFHVESMVARLQKDQADTRRFVGSLRGAALREVQAGCVDPEGSITRFVNGEPTVPEEDARSILIAVVKIRSAKRAGWRAKRRRSPSN